MHGNCDSLTTYPSRNLLSSCYSGNDAHSISTVRACQDFLRIVLGLNTAGSSSASKRPDPAAIWPKGWKGRPEGRGVWPGRRNPPPWGPTGWPEGQASRPLSGRVRPEGRAFRPDPGASRPKGQTAWPFRRPSPPMGQAARPPGREAARSGRKTLGAGRIAADTAHKCHAFAWRGTLSLDTAHAVVEIPGNAPGEKQLESRLACACARLFDN